MFKKERQAETKVDSEQMLIAPTSSPNAAKPNVGGMPNRILKFHSWGMYGDWDDSEDKKSWKMVDADSLAFEDYQPICDLLKSEKNKEYFMQFTGCYDKNNKEIYEGDIIKALKNIHKKNGVVTFNNACFMLSFENEEYALGFYQGQSGEVIGNIFQTPELL